MDSETEKTIAEQMKKLPKDIIAAIVSVDFKSKLQEITTRQKLLIDQAGKLEMETTLVMIGLEPLADYVSNLQREMGLNIVRAKEIAMDVSEHIFKPIRESLKKMNEGEEEEEKIEAPKDEPAGELNRDQILNEIENPKPNRQTTTVMQPEERGLETLAEVPFQQDIKPPLPNLIETKLGGITITTQQVVNAAPEQKLPEIEKKRPSSGADPYREPLM